jgi:uncharacterized membrane protein YgcG
MKLTRSITALAMTCALLLAAAARADAEPQVNDQAHFFKKEAVDTVDGELKQLKSDTHVEVVVETLEKIPENLQPVYDAAKDDAGRKHFFENLVKSRALEAKFPGVFVLIVKQPAHLEVLADHEKAMPHEDEGKMASILLEDFKARKFDEGLQKAIDFARDTIKKNHNGAKP